MTEMFVDEDNLFFKIQTGNQLRVYLASDVDAKLAALEMKLAKVLKERDGWERTSTDNLNAALRNATRAEYAELCENNNEEPLSYCEACNKRFATHSPFCLLCGGPLEDANTFVKRYVMVDGPAEMVEAFDGAVGPFYYLASDIDALRQASNKEDEK